MSYQSKYLNAIFNISDDILTKLQSAALSCEPLFREIDSIAEYQQLRVLQAFWANNVSDFHLNGSTGYGYGDSGRDTLESIYAAIFKTEAALVRSQIVSGTHALAIGLFGNLKSGEEVISVTGKPYDTLLKVIGVNGKVDGSLIDSGVKYTEIPLNNASEIDMPAILDTISSQTKMIYFQRSKGYEYRPSINIAELEKAISAIKENHPDLICMVDNCYGEFVEEKEPTEIGADLIGGSLIKNPGGGLALAGGYLAGKADLIRRAASRLTAPGIGQDVGASFNFNRFAYQGLFMSPLIVAQALKGSVLAAEFFASLGYPVSPEAHEHRTDIIQAIRLGSPERVLAFCRGIQKACPLDAHARPEAAFLPGYADPIVMAGGTFVQGSSIELSADAPMRLPYNVFLQGGLSLGHIKIGLALAANEITLLALKENGN